MNSWRLVSREPIRTKDDQKFKLEDSNMVDRVGMKFDSARSRL